MPKVCAAPACAKQAAFRAEHAPAYFKEGVKDGCFVAWHYAAEYLEQERKAEFKSEYVNGRVYAMSGVSDEHSTIAANLVGELHTRFRGQPCKVHGSDMRVQVEDTGKYAYPDVTVVCGASQFADTHMDTLINPIILIEVLSPSTEAYDRGAKFAHYQYITTLQEYVLVSQNRPLVEKYTRQGEQWLLTMYRGLNAVLELASVDCRIPLHEIYDRVTFPDDENA